MANKTEIFALFGNPVAHSLSALMHNAAYRKMGMEALYVPFCVKDIAEAIRAARVLGIRGASITIPFKTDVMASLDEIDPSARTIGAVNTVFSREGKLFGFNTDWTGLLAALRTHFDPAGKTFAILGAGGAARAALHAVRQSGGGPLLVNRSMERAQKVAAEFGCPFLELSRIGAVRADCLINATPIGMSPHADASPVCREALVNFKWVMDMIYNPLETRLLREAREVGSYPISGLDMLVHQGAEQIRLWTGVEPPRALMREIVLENLT